MQPSHLSTVNTWMYTVVTVSSSKVTSPVVCYQYYLGKPSLKITASRKEFKLHKPTAVRDAYIFLLQLLSADWHNTNPVSLRLHPSSTKDPWILGMFLYIFLTSKSLTSFFAKTQVLNLYAYSRYPATSLFCSLKS